jgi:hypothetical protein
MIFSFDGSFAQSFAPASSEIVYLNVTYYSVLKRVCTELCMSNFQIVYLIVTYYSVSLHRALHHQVLQLFKWMLHDILSWWEFTQSFAVEFSNCLCKCYMIFSFDGSFAQSFASSSSKLFKWLLHDILYWWEFT